MTDLNIIEESNLKCILIWTIATFAGKLNLNKTQLTRHQSLYCIEIKNTSTTYFFLIQKFWFQIKGNYQFQKHMYTFVQLWLRCNWTNSNPTSNLQWHIFVSSDFSQFSYLLLPVCGSLQSLSSPISYFFSWLFNQGYSASTF